MNEKPPEMWTKSLIEMTTRPADTPITGPRKSITIGASFVVLVGME